jgi:hypothetical protein
MATFVPVRVVATPHPVAHASAGAARPDRGEIKIILAGGRQIRVRGLVEVAWLGQVVRTLERLGC